MEHVARVEHVSGVWHLLAVDLDEAVHAELAGLSDTAGEQGAEDGCIETTLNRVVCHLHVGRHRRGPRLVGRVCTSTASGGLLAAVVAGEVLVVHGHDGGNAALEQAGPFLLADLLAVVGSGVGFGGPFLLEEGARGDVGLLELRQTVQRPARHVLSDFLLIVTTGLNALLLQRVVYQLLQRMESRLLPHGGDGSCVRGGLGGLGACGLA